MDDLGDQYDTRTSFIDALLSGQMNLFVLLIIAVVMMNPDSENKSKVDKKAELMMAVEWQSGVDCDVDTWVKGPDGTIVWYGSKDGGYMNIERDDTGTRNDRYIDAEGKLIYNPVNVEYWTLRQIVPGEYVVNLYSYACRVEGRDVESLDFDLTAVTTLVDLNPSASDVATERTTFSRIYEEAHVFRFKLSPEGKVERVWSEPTNMVRLSR